VTSTVPASALADVHPAFARRQGAASKVSAVPFGRIPYEPRRALWDGMLYFGSVTMLAGFGSSGKGMLACAIAARAVLGLPFPGDDQAARYTPVSVLWTSGPTEDDQAADLAPRLRAAIRAAVREFGLDPELAGNGEAGAINLVHGLNQWAGALPVTYPADCGRVRAEIAAVDAESAESGRPPVGLVVADSVRSLLSDGHTINSGQGATRVMLAMSAFAHGEQSRGEQALCVLYLHHLNAGGRVAGSEAVLDALRYVFEVRQDKDNEAVRVIIKRKANSRAAEPQRFAVAGDGADGHAVFETEPDPAAARVEAAVRARAVGGAPLRAALPPAPAAALPGPAAASPRDTDGAPFRLITSERAEGADAAGPPERIGDTYATRSAAYAAAAIHAGRVLDWQPAGRPDMDVAGFARDGAAVAYGVMPAPRPAPAPVWRTESPVPAPAESASQLAGSESEV
jgi:hypothetical protein